MISARAIQTAPRRRVRLTTVLLLVSTLSIGCANMFGFRREKAHSPNGLATYRLPANWTPREEVQQPTAALYEYRKSQSWWMGAGDPLEVHAFTVIMKADADEATMQAALLEATNRIHYRATLFDEFGSMKEGDRETWIREGSYQISTLHKPEQVIVVRSLDRVRKVAFAARVYKRKINHEAILKITRTFFSSITISEKRNAFFGEVSDWPAVRAARLERETTYLNNFLSARQLPPIRRDQTVLHDGWIYTVLDDEFYLARVLGPRVLNTPAYGARGELVWLTHRGGRWESWRASNAAKPKRSEPYFPSSEPLPLWASHVGAEPGQAWFFTVRRCQLTGETWEEERDLNACDLAGWFENAKKVEADFKAGKLFIE